MSFEQDSDLNSNLNADFINSDCSFSLRQDLASKIFSSTSHEIFSRQKLQLQNLIERVINFSESDSALICGPAGCGKTSLVKKVLKELENYDFFLVQLNGLIHTDDNLALKEIIQTLNANESIINEASGSFACNLTVILQNLLTDFSSVDKPVVFVLDEFHLFCTHNRQTLLYTLMDASQSVKVPVCVIGVTSCFEVTQLLEKRVKSRFSHNQILLYPPTDFQHRLELFKWLLTPSKKLKKKFDVVWVHVWEEELEKICENPKVIEVLRKQHSFFKSEQVFRQTMFALISRLEPEYQHLESNDVINCFNDTFKDKIVFALQGLSVLELCLVIAINHQTNLFDDDPFNFEMIARRYLNFTNSKSVTLPQTRTILMKAFQKLISLELIIPVHSFSKDVLKEFNLYHSNITDEQIKAAIQNYSMLPPVISEWATSSIL